MIVVGIAGGTASGKTTVARAAAAALGPSSLLLSHDRYYHPLPNNYRDRPLDYNFDHPRALDTARLIDDLAALQAGRSAAIPQYDFSTCSRSDPVSWERVEPAEVVVLEGILIFADDALRSMLDHKVFVHAPADLRLARRLRRDVLERGDSYDAVLAQYLATVRPMHEAFVEPSRAHADVVVDGIGPVHAAVAGIRSLLG